MFAWMPYSERQGLDIPTCLMRQWRLPSPFLLPGSSFGTFRLPQGSVSINCFGPTQFGLASTWGLLGSYGERAEDLPEQDGFWVNYSAATWA